jgi:hypothetical protein
MEKKDIEELELDFEEWLEDMVKTDYAIEFMV